MEKKIKVFSTPACPYCQQAKEYLKSKNVSFESVDLAANPDAAQEMIKISGQMSVPVIIIGEDIVVGFDKDKLESLLA